MLLISEEGRVDDAKGPAEFLVSATGREGDLDRATAVKLESNLSTKFNVYSRKCGFNTHRKIDASAIAAVGRTHSTASDAAVRLDNVHVWSRAVSNGVSDGKADEGSYA